MSWEVHNWSLQKQLLQSGGNSGWFRWSQVNHKLLVERQSPVADPSGEVKCRRVVHVLCAWVWCAPCLPSTEGPAHIISFSLPPWHWWAPYEGCHCVCGGWSVALLLWKQGRERTRLEPCKLQKCLQPAVLPGLALGGHSLPLQPPHLLLSQYKCQG